MSYYDREPDWEKVGLVDVDAGSVTLGDPCYVVGSDASGFMEWPEYCKYLDGHKEQVYHHGGKGYIKMPSGHFHFQTLYGDGSYPVYVKKNDQGQVTKVMIDFDPDLDEDDEEEEW